MDKHSSSLLGTTLIYLNGEYLDPASPEAKISPFDRGFLFGDSAYEVIMIAHGKIMQAEDHLKRLDRSLALLEIPHPHSHHEYLQIIQKLITAASDPQKNLMLYLQVSRGIDSFQPFYRQVPYDAAIALTPTVFIYACPLFLPTTSEEYARVKLKIYEDIRWKRCEIKSTNLLPNAMIRSDAQKNGAYDGLLVRDGEVIECAGNNIFMIKNGALFTPPESELMLSGTMRLHILRIASKLHIPCHEQKISLTEILDADEVWACCTTRDILPVTHLLHQESPLENKEICIGDGQAGPLWHQVIAEVLAIRDLHTHRN